MQWMTLFNKEMLENWRNKKWLWVPLVMMIVTIMDPISYYFLPYILENMGDMPDGAILEMPAVKAEAAFMMSIESLSMYGALILILIFMGTITNERQLGITELILAKPIDYRNYITAKWAAYISLAIISLLVSLSMSWYYTNLLFGSLSIQLFILTVAFYSVWFIFVISLTIFFNTFCKNAGLVVACTIGSLFSLSGINAVVGYRLTWFPNQLAAHLNEMLLTSEVSGALLGTVGIIICLILLLLTVSIIIFQRKELI